MSFVQPETIQRIAGCLPVSPLTADATKALAPHIDVRLREIIQEASKFLRHSKRQGLTCEDINNALRLRNCESLCGFGGKDPARFVKAAGHPDLYYLEDLDLPVGQVVETQLPRLPVDVGVVPHWLAIDGVQPNIPEQGPVEKVKRKRPHAENVEQRQVKQKKEQGEQKDARQPETGDQQISVVIPPVRQVLSAELQLYLDKIKKLLETADAASSPSTQFQSLPSSQPQGRQASNPGTSISDRAREERALFASLATDPGLHPLVVALVELIIVQVRNCMKRLPQLRILVKMARALLQNDNIHIEQYLHKLVSPLLTCMVTKRLGNQPTEDHWSIRDSAADVIAMICKNFGQRYPDLLQRISKQLVNALTDPTKPLATHYGAIVGLTKLGQRVVQMLVLPNAESCLKLIDPALQQSKDQNQQREALHVYKALQHACASCMYANMTSKFSKEYFLHLTTEPLHKLHESRLAIKKPAKKGGPSKAAASTDNTDEAEDEEKQENGGGLDDAWREDYKLGEHLEAVHSIFGDAIHPYVPFTLLAQL